MYSGIRRLLYVVFAKLTCTDYDAVSLSPLPVSPPSFHTTVFPTSDQNILHAADQLVSRLKAEHYYTDTASFDLRCGVCGAGLTGESGAREHARQTGRKSSITLFVETSDNAFLMNQCTSPRPPGEHAAQKLTPASDVEFGEY